MKLIRPSHEILAICPDNLLQFIERCGRTCYRSEDKITEDSAEGFCERLIKSGHHSVLEHSLITVKFVCDRGVSHELVRHRLAAYSQESTRYCDYRGEVSFVIPPWLDLPEKIYKTTEDFKGLQNNQTGIMWMSWLLKVEQEYFALLNRRWHREQARSVLPNSLATEIVCSTNVREWRHILNLRCSKAAHPQMREVMLPLLHDLVRRSETRILFRDIADKYFTDMMVEIQREWRGCEQIE